MLLEGEKGERREQMSGNESFFETQKKIKI